MIVLSRHRDSPESDSTLAEALTSGFSMPVSSIPFLYDLRAFGPTCRHLRESAATEPLFLLAPLPVRAMKALADFLEIPVQACFDTAEKTVEQILSGLRSDPVFCTVFRIADNKNDTENNAGSVKRFDEPTVRRWYPLIEAENCIGCLECVNFCLFGVYAIGAEDRPFVDQPDACRNGCPACSRVCPGGAILFPMHEDPLISGRKQRLTEDDDVFQRQAEAERQRHLPGLDEKTKDDLDDLVEQVDHFHFDDTKTS